MATSEWCSSSADFDGLTAGAVWQDLKVGVEHLRVWKRIALVTDIEWMSQMTAMFGWMTPGTVKHFPLAERAAAIAWISGEPGRYEVA